MQTLYECSMDEGVYVDHIHHPCGMWWHHVDHLHLDVACDFIYATNEILIIHVGCNLFLVVNYSRKLKFFFYWQPTPMLKVSMGHHPQWNMMVSNIAYMKGALSARHLITPPSLRIFVDSWWSKWFTPLCDENQTPSMWIGGTSHHCC